jgi:glycosyltransferase involved in cell wall biosynthesis
MKVSIIVPVYNVAPYIERCLQSIVNQTYTNIECILVDDCGTDNSIEIAQKFINDYRGNISFTILHHDKNKGQSAARNTALQYTKGDYVFFLDSDDAITSDCIELLMFLAIKYPDADFVQGNTLDDSTNIRSYSWHTHLPEYCNEHEQLEKIILFTVVTSAWNKVMKTSFLIEHKLYFPESIIHEDTYWSFFLAKYTRAAAFVNKGTYIYYINDNSTITSISKHARIRRYTSRLYASKAFCADLDKEKKSSRCQRLYIAGNLTSAMIEVAALHSLNHWRIFWHHVWKLYANHNNLTFWQHIFFLFLMPPLCFPIGIKGWYWRVQKYIVNRI